MSIKFQDRISTYPNRYKLKKSDGTSELVTLERADSPTQVGTPLNAATFNALQKGHTPRNLLDNSDFRNPVNQRGVTVSSNGFIVDRWYVFNRTDGTNDTATLTADGIVTNGASYLQQRIPKGIMKDGEKYTLAVHYSDGTMDVNTNGEYMLFDGFDLVNYITSNGKTIASVALYEGEYTAETLPEYQPKGYGAELAECQRYYLNLNWEPLGYGYINGAATLAYIAIPIPVRMRTAPTITNGTVYVKYADTQLAGTEITLNDHKDNCITIGISGTYAKGSSVASAFTQSAFTLSADL